jgi:hypothetical protein
MAEGPIDSGPILEATAVPAERSAPAGSAVAPARVEPGVRPASRLVPALVYALALANLVALWCARGDYVTGFDLFGASAGVVALERDGVLGALHRFAASVLAQRGRMRATGDDSLLYAFVPGLLNQLVPWLFWSHALSLALFVAAAAWVARRLGLPFVLLCAATVASPAITSFSILGFPFLASAAVPFALALGWVLPPSRAESGVVAIARDLLVCALVTFVAFNGYPSGQVFFVVPAIGALTLPGVPWTRRASWLACAGVVAWVVYTNQAAPTTAALAAVPADPWTALVEGAGRVARRYLLDWYVDFPALLFAAAVGVFVLPRERLFWGGLLAVLLALCSLSAFQFGGALFGPRRLMPFLFVASIVAAAALAPPSPRTVARMLVAGLVGTGIAYTSLRTVRFVTAETSDQQRDYNYDRVYSLPYAHSGVDMQIWRDRIHDARVLADAIAKGREQHVFFYGFGMVGEDGVNPQLFVARLMLPLGVRRFRERTVFFDNQDHNLIDVPFGIHRLAAVPVVLPRDVRAPFWLHVKEPEHDGPSMVARHFNRARVTEVDLGLENFRSYRVDAYRPPGPIPVAPLRDAAAAPTGLKDGLCRTTWRQRPGRLSPLVHWFTTLPTQLEIIARAAGRPAETDDYFDVARGVSPAVVADAPPPTSATHLRGLLWSPEAETPARLQLAADDEIALVVNRQTILESLGPQGTQTFAVDVVLPKGLSELVIAHHRFHGAPRGVLSFSSAAADGRPLPWGCPPGFPDRES